MILGIGTDIVEITRVRDSIERYGEHFLRKLFTAGEQAYCQAKSGQARWSSFAARFAAKEAFSKALGTGIGKHAAWTAVEVQIDSFGKPSFKLHEQLAERLAGCAVHVSLSHSADYATAVVVIERGELG